MKNFAQAHNDYLDPDMHNRATRRVPKKPYQVKCREEGRGKPSIERFATLIEAEAYIKARWQGPEYMDGKDAFHTDYSTYELVGFDLTHIGKRVWNAEWQCMEFIFNFDMLPKPEPKCKDDSCDANHCPKCGGHKIGWYSEGLCSSCDPEKESSWKTEDA